MATLEKRNGTYRVVFPFQGRKYSRSLKTRTGRCAIAALALARLEDNLHRIELGTLEAPGDTDLAAFLLSDGRKVAKPLRTASRWTVGKMLDAYLQAIAGSVEESTLHTIKIHVGHLKRILRASTSIENFGAIDLQRYVDRRSREKSRRSTISTTTVRKEIATLGAAWCWSNSLGITSSMLPSKTIRYAKLEEKPPFQTWGEIGTGCRS